MATLEEFKTLRDGGGAEVQGELYRLFNANPESTCKRMAENVSSVMKINRKRVWFWLAFGLMINTSFHPVKALERLGTMPGTAAPRSWRNDTPKGFIKDGCFENVCSYDRIVSRKGDIVVTDSVSEKGEPRYEYLEIKKTQNLWNCRDGSMGWRNYKRLKSDQGNWGPWHWGAWRTASTKWPDNPHLKRICQDR